MRYKLCVPCMILLKDTEKYDIRHVESRRDSKITCRKCRRRRYGAVYDVSGKDALTANAKTTGKERSGHNEKNRN